MPNYEHKVFGINAKFDMNDLFIALFLISLPILAIGLVKPSIIRFPNRKRVLLFVGGSSVLFFVLIGATLKPQPKNIASKQEASTPPPTTAPSTPSPTSTPTEHELNAEVRFSDTAFMITNKEDKEWTSCKLEINSGLFSSGYTYRLDSLKPKDPTIIPFREFTKGDGTRFDSYATKVQNLSISCEVDGQHGFNYYGVK